MGDVERFLNTLGEEPLGAIALVNLCACCEEGLVPPEDVRAFLVACTELAESEPTTAAVSVFRRVSATLTPDGLRPRFLRLCRTAGADSPSFSNTTSYIALVKHHASKSPPLGVAPLPTPPPDSEREREALRLQIEGLSEHPDWHKADATLGRPLPDVANCWISMNGFADSRDDVSARDATAADRVRDALGLIDFGRAAHMVTYSFDAPSALALGDLEMARPTFADLGNSRFQVRHNCARSREMAAAGWGCTVNLGRIPEVGARPASGQPERVTRPLRFSELKTLQIRYLEATSTARGASLADNDESFLQVLLDGQMLSTIRESILKFLGD